MLRKLLTRSGSGGVFECDGRLVVGRTSSDVDDDPAVGERYVRHLVIPLARDDGPAAQDVGVEAAGTLDIIGNDEMGQDDLLIDGAHADLRCWN
jgi:hypothetical protein